LKSPFCAAQLDKVHETELLAQKFLPIFYRKTGKKSTILNKKKGSIVKKMLFAHTKPA